LDVSREYRPPPASCVSRRKGEGLPSRDETGGVNSPVLNQKSYIVAILLFDRYSDSRPNRCNVKILFFSADVRLRFDLILVSDARVSPH